MRDPVKAYPFAIAVLIAAVLIRWLLDPVLGDTLPLVTLFGAIAAAAWAGGPLPALLNTILGYIVCNALFITPRGQLSFGDSGQVAGVLAYLFTCALIIGFGEAMRRAQLRARERREILQVTLRSIGDAVITTDIEGRVTYLNTIAESLTGWMQSEALGKPLDAIFRIINEQSREPVESPATRALREGIVVGLANHTVLLRKDGSERPIDDSAAPIRDDRGRVSGCVLIFRDVSAQRGIEREKANQLLTARLLASIVESSDDAIVSKSLAGIIQTWNAGAERVFGYTAEQAVGQHISLVIPADRIDEEEQIIGSIKAGKRIDHFETERVRSDGQRIRVSLTVSPIKDEVGNVVGASKIARDVTRQRQAEERERQLLAEANAANAKFHAFFDQGVLFAALASVDGIMIEPNRFSSESSGYTREQILGKPLWECPWWTRSPELVERIKVASAQAPAGETFRGEVPYFLADGSERTVDLTIQPIRDEQDRVLFLASTGTDITDRKRAEADREKFVTLIENSPDFIGICDLNGVPFFVNRAGLKMVGLDSIEQARAVSVGDFFFPEDQSRVVEQFFPLVRSRGHGEIEIRFRHFKTGDARWMAYKVLTLKNAAGQPLAFATVSQDVTERKRMEDNLRSLAAHLSEADRRKDEFLAMLAHELRNPLAPISNAVHVLRLAESDKDAVHLSAEMLERQVGQLSRLVDDLLDVSRITRGKIELRKERVELGPVVSQAVEAARALYTSMNHQLSITLPPQPLYVDADQARIAQVIGNLLNNACKFTDPGGRVALEVTLEGKQVVIRVRDSGIGIAAENLPRVFDMFAQVDTTLERSRDGLGIGLTLVKKLVEMHNGTVEVHSDIGHGSEFVARLPIAIDVAKPISKPSVGEKMPSLSRRVLIVDDNKDGARSLAMLLKLAGHQTELAHDGIKALEAAERLRPDAVLLDIGLPKLNGYEVCRRIREQPWGKDLMLIAVSGWGQEEDVNKSKNAGFNNHMVKPVDHDALIKLIASVPSSTKFGQRGSEAVSVADEADRV